LPISADVIGRDDIVVGGKVSVDRLITDLEDAPNATADGNRPPVVTSSLPVGRDDGAGREIPPFGRL
jgi:hypothetical protein